MSIVKSEDSQKWINSFLAVLCILTGYLVIRFTNQLSEWFDLRAHIPSFNYVRDGVGILFGVAGFVFVKKSDVVMTHLKEVYAELVKVVWPDKDTILKITVGLVIGLSIVSSIFLLVDFLFIKLLELLY